jgi:hypothetical protein
MEEWLQAGLRTAVATALIGWMLWLARRDPRIEEGVIVLRYPLPMRVFLWVAGSLALLVVGWMVTDLLSGTPDPIIAQHVWWMLPVFAFMAVVALVEPRVQLKLDGDGIRGQTAYRGRRELAWQDLVCVRWSLYNNWFVSRDRHGETLRISRFLHGHEALPAMLERTVAEKVWKAAVRGYQQSGGGAVARRRNSRGS